MNFASDNVYGVDPRILAAMVAANEGTARSYSYDNLTEAARARLAQVFEHQVAVHLVTTGTAANGLALSAATPPYGAVICHAEAHIAVDECNAPELFTGGAKLIGIHGRGGKITPAEVEGVLKGFIRGEHDPKPACLSITNASEAGTVYRPAEVKALADLVHAHGMTLHMDGARFANALASLGCSPAELTWQAGVDIMSFGGTKNGGMMLEAVVIFDATLAREFNYRQMRGGQLVSKSRFLAAQMLAYLENDLWLDNARTANGLAQRLAQGLARVKGVRIGHAVEANEVFAVLPRAAHEAWQKAGAVYYDWLPDGLEQKPGPDEVFARFVLSHATPEDAVHRFLALTEK
jgi:threonine aldolase